MSTASMLEFWTSCFWKEHWSPEKMEGFTSGWSRRWEFAGEIPNHDKQGVYAFLRGSEVIYIGSGASRNHGRYSGHGLGARLHNYWEVDRTQPAKQSSLKQYKYKGAISPPPDAIVTFGLTAPYGYLAPSLEAFLIGKLQPELNHVKLGTISSSV